MKHRCVHIMRILQGLNERGKRHILCAKIKQIKQGYEEVMEYVIRDTGLSAAQIEQLRKAVEAKMPAEDVLEMAKNRKYVMEIRRCIEFYEMMEKEQEPQEKAKKNRRERR